MRCTEEGSSYMASSSRLSVMRRSPRAPESERAARVAIHRSAESDTSSRAPFSASCAEYCRMSALRGRTSTSTSCSTESGASATCTGSRPISSGIIPKRTKSLTTACASMVSFLRRSSRQKSSWCRCPPKLGDARMRAATISSSPWNAPPRMNMMLDVSIAMKSPRGFFRPPFSGTFTTVPSSIFSSACCTPSPETSRVMDTFSALRAILSTSSMYTMPLSAARTS
mmetsp:Transcript_15568/g.41892  ORF Transcript_15568/g.41892 Transcript_15568/m.41892 type:complete len:226 (-) Transcript_15568:932-1609(-)